MNDSDFKVEICIIDEILEHPNADSLEIAKVKGWHSCVSKGQYKAGDIIIYVPLDSILPLKLSDELNITQYLSKQRVRMARLRGEYSEGLILDLDLLPKAECVLSSGKNYKLPIKFNIGEDVGELLGITKYEPPVKPSQLKGNSVKRKDDHPKFFKYTKIGNIKNHPRVLQEDEEVVITEKIHGTNFRVANINGKFYVGSHNVTLYGKETNKFKLKIAEWAKVIYDFTKIKCFINLHRYHKCYYKTNVYGEISERLNLKDVLEPGEQLFGEIYGEGIQELNYNMKGIKARFFDVMVDNKYVDYEAFVFYCDHHNLEIVPKLYVGPWSEDCRKLATGKSALGNCIREGIVIKPTVERLSREDEHGHRVILKDINQAYLMKDYGDYH